MKKKSVLLIAGSDSSAGAGIQADIKTLTFFKVYAATVFTALTAQNTRGVNKVFNVPIHFIEEQIKIIFNNLTSSLISSNNFCNFFQASSSEMFGNTNTEILNENTNFSPNSPYASAKLNNHNLVKEYSSKYNWNIFSGIMFNHESRFRHENYLIMKIIFKREKIFL